MFKNFFGYHIVADYHKKKDPKRYRVSGFVKAIIASIIAIAICCVPTESFGIAGFTFNEKIVVALFVWAAIMWVSEAIPSWSTSVLIIVILLLTVSDKAFSFLAHEGVASTVNGEEVIFGAPVSYKSILATFADPTIMLFIGGFVLAIGMSKVKLDLVAARIMLKPFKDIFNYRLASRLCNRTSAPHGQNQAVPRLQHSWCRISSYGGCLRWP